MDLISFAKNPNSDRILYSTVPYILLNVFCKSMESTSVIFPAFYLQYVHNNDTYFRHIFYELALSPF